NTVIQAVADFFREQIAKIKQFWDQNGQMILQAFRNVFNGIWAVVQPIIMNVWDIFQTVMPHILNIVKTVWNMIKGVISGVLDVIMGLVKTFPGLLTGDFKKMWQGIKQI